METHPFIPLFKVFMAPEVDEEVLKVLHSGFIGQGPKVDEFEREIARLICQPNVLTLNSCTSSIHLALHLIGVKGGEVIVPPMTSAASVFPILANGGKVVWGDVNPSTGNLDPQSVEEQITERTKAILVVDFSGTPADLDEIRQVANGIPIIEDAAQGFGSYYKERPVGSISDYTCFSFQAIKHVTCVDGGALVCKDREQYRRGKLIRWYGISREQVRQDLRCEAPIPEWGYKFHMNDVAATIGLVNMRHLDDILKKHRDHALKYCTQLKIPTVPFHLDRVSSWWSFIVFPEDRPGFIQRMTEKGIHVSRVHERVDKHPCVDEFRRDLPGMDEFVGKMIGIPVGWWLTEEDVEYIVNTINEGW